MNRQGPGGIRWCDYSWNPMTGCSKVSPGCRSCYSERIAHRFAGTKAYPNGFAVTLHPERLGEPGKLKAPAGTKIFVCDMGDLFHEEVPDDFILSVMGVIVSTPHLIFQVLTKRSKRMKEFFFKLEPIPFPNLWLGVSVENQKTLHRIDDLVATPAAVRFVSFEPLLEDPGLVSWRGIGWAIVGGESGPGARPMNPDWALSLKDQCVANDVAFFFKQHGGRGPDKGGHVLDGRTWEEFPK